MPSDAHEVVRLFAIAARHVCVQPKAIEAISRDLLLIDQLLEGFARSAADECVRMWKLFARVAQLPKDSLRLEAARAFCRDLDSLGQKLDLAPLAEWTDLPSHIDEPGYSAWAAPHQTPAHATTPEKAAYKPLAQIAVEAKQLAAEGPLSAENAARLLAALAPEERQRVFQQMIGQGELGRSDANLLIRYLLKGGAIGPEGGMLREVLERFGAFLRK